MDSRIILRGEDQKLTQKQEIVSKNQTKLNFSQLEKKNVEFSTKTWRTYLLLQSGNGTEASELGNIMLQRIPKKEESDGEILPLFVTFFFLMCYKRSISISPDKFFPRRVPEKTINILVKFIKNLFLWTLLAQVK